MPDTTTQHQEALLPLYYKETFFSGDTLLHPELPGGSYGVAGNDVPYTVRGDDVVTGMLLCSFIIGVVVSSLLRADMAQQLKSIFYTTRADSQETPGGIMPYFLALQTCLLLAVTCFLYVVSYQQATFLLNAPYQMVAIFFCVFIGYFLLKLLVCDIVNNVFFTSKKNRQWKRGLLFITALEGFALFPVVMLQVYVGLSMQTMTYCLVFILIIAKILTFYKCWLIFFRQMSGFLQIILYLCALEIVPVLSLLGFLVTIVDGLKVIF